mmetsp:Transcript_11043/g.12994  ORF Transcript_11043/g.12994 Transcript_11043/m.12994 type:complete len:98 (-) Transcript_11043:234-527(-)
MHGSCCLREALYVFCGEGHLGSRGTVEKLDLRSLTQNSKWQQIEAPCLQMRLNPVVCPINTSNKDEIVILGGFTSSPSDGVVTVVFDTVRNIVVVTR